MKKGFTLIEILAVIIVLALVSVIAAPSLIGVINKSRLNALKSSAYGLINASISMKVNPFFIFSLLSKYKYIIFTH